MVATNGLLPEAVGEIKVVRLVKDSKADERKKSLKSYFAPMAYLANVSCSQAYRINIVIGSNLYTRFLSFIIFLPSEEILT